MAEGDYQPEPYRPTFPLDFNGSSYEYRKQKYQPPSHVYQSSYGKEGAFRRRHYQLAQGRPLHFRADGGKHTGNDRAQVHPEEKDTGELQHLKYDLQDRINQTMYFGDRLPTMVKRRSDLEKQLLQMGTEALREDQAFWKDIALLAKELRYKLEQYKKEKAKGDFF